jgi:hypothetical protein
MYTAAIINYMDCPLCCDSFDQATKIPRILPCGHTFCELCICAISKQSLSDISVECPHCRCITSIKSTADLPKNYFLADMMESQKKRISPTEQCAAHPKKKISYFCKQCNTSICSKCLLSHNGHDMYSIEDQGKHSILMKDYSFMQ